MKEREALRIANERGWTSYMLTVNGSMYVLKHATYPFVVELWPETDEFALRYNTGLFQFGTGKCGSFSDHQHFNRFLRKMIHYVTYIKDAEEDLNK